MPNNKKNRNIKNIEKNNNGIAACNINWEITTYEKLPIKAYK